MSEQSGNPKSPGTTYVEPSSFADDHLQPRDYIYALEVDFDVDAQLMAIGGLLHRNRNADQSVRDEIKRIEEHARHLKDVEEAEWAAADWVDQLVHSTYQDAAHSMSAVGMLAPLVETVFYQCFQSIGKRFYPATHPHKTHDRWHATHGLQWDCHFVVAHGRTHKDIVKGIFQLSDAVGLTPRFPADLKAVLSALFAYRNSMFHHGFEWPVEERERFAKRIESEGWPADWFSVATSNGKPWMFSLSDKFIRHCNKTIEQVLQAIGGFVRDELLPKERGASG
jgi:hypothetical protein